MHPDVQELQPKLKEILYDCAVELRATKAALYLYDGATRYELVTEYGFRGTTRQWADRNDPIVDRCGRGRSAFFINGLTVEPRFSEILYEASTDRLLAAPIYLRGQLVGLIDMRDKAAKQAFDNTDLPKAQRIAERIGELFGNKNVFGQRYITLSETPDAAPRPAAPPATPPPTAPAAPARPADAAPSPAAVSPPPAPRPVAPQHGSRVPRLATLIIEARNVASRVVVPPSPESIGDNELAVVRDLLRALLLIPGVAVVSFSAFGHMGGVQEVAARGTVTDEASSFLQSKLNIWLTKRGESAGGTKTNVQTPFGTATPITAAQLVKVFTAPVVAGSLRALYLTVAFTGVPDRTTHELLATLLGQLQTAIESSMERGVLGSLRARVADALLEPDFTRYPELRAHSERVVARAEALARHLAMSQSEVDVVKIVARVHDVGMRLLEYDRLYRKPDLSPEEMNILREHVVVGAAVVEPLLGSEIARAVLCHHERVDGRGYPNELQGDEIPRVSRVVQVCDVYETMVAPDNGYQAPVVPETALSMIAQNAGTQFDVEVAHRFMEMMARR